MVRNMKYWIASSAAGLSALVIGLGTTAGAAPVCNAANFTVGGVFDLQGYLACQAGPSLPSTGNGSLQIAGIAAGLLVIGGASVITSRKNRAAQSI